MRPAPLLLSLLCSGLLLGGPPRDARATDVDGGNDCTRPVTDYGSAPEGIIAYPSGVIGMFPTCLAPGPVAVRDGMCGTVGPTPGPAGYVRHVQTGASNYWLGCFSTAAGPSGIDSETDGKVSLGGGASACGGISTDCLQVAFGSLPYGKDECTGDNSDAGVTVSAFAACALATLPIAVYNCGMERIAYLNVCIDLNHDGDWVDAIPCTSPAACAPEWAVMNVPVTLTPGCNQIQSPSFRIGPTPGPSWMRVTISDAPVPSDFPWNGSASAPGGQLNGGETEDYPVVIDAAVAAPGSTWGTVKTRYHY